MTANAFLDACGWTPTSGGTGTWTVSAAIQGYQTLAAAATAQGVASGAVLSYRSESLDKTQWEEGFGPSGSSNTTLARSTITANSLGTTVAVNFTNPPNVFITGLSADLQNASLLTSGTLPVARLNGGTANQFVQGDGSFQTQARKLLNTLTAASSASLSDITSFANGFANYEIEFDAIVPATSNVLFNLLVHSGGSFQTTSYQSTTNTAQGSTWVANTSNATSIQISNFVANALPGFNGTLKVFGPSGTAGSKIWKGEFAHHTPSGTPFYVLVSGFWINAAAIDGFSVSFASGAIASGIIKVYGLN